MEEIVEKIEESVVETEVVDAADETGDAAE